MYVPLLHTTRMCKALGLEPFSAACPVSLRCSAYSGSLRGRLHRCAMETCSARIDPHTVFALAPCAISLKNALGEGWSSAFSNSSVFIVTGRAGRSSVLSRRAEAYRGLPLRLSAEYIGGTCRSLPRKRASAASTSSRVQRTGRALNMRPCASPVAVVAPSAFVASSKSCANLVASPKHKGSNPEASGSSVPVCPALAADIRCCARLSASWLERPTGLSSNNTPLSSVLIGVSHSRADKARRRGQYT